MVKGVGGAKRAKGGSGVWVHVSARKTSGTGNERGSGREDYHIDNGG